MNHRNSHNKGITLIETLVYVALLSLLMTGVFSSVFIVINAGQKEGISSAEENTAQLMKKYHD